MKSGGPPPASAVPEARDALTRFADQMDAAQGPLIP